MSDELDDLPTLATFRDELVAVAGRRRRPGRSRLTLVAALLAGSALAATAGAATFAGLRAVVIPDPPSVDVAPEMAVSPGSARVLTIRVPDPSDGTIWTLRRARVQGGEQCLTVGQTQAGAFGLVGLDGRFRTLGVGFVDGCGAEQAAHASVLGARVFSAATRTRVRTAIYGEAGSGLTAVTLKVAGERRARSVPVRSGAFLAVAAGYPEDRPLTVTLRFADGHHERRVFGASPSIIVDPGGGPALKVSGLIIDSAVHTPCMVVGAARPAAGPASGPAACGTDRIRRPFGAVRRVTPGRHGTPGAGGYDWRDFPARTLAWGAIPHTGPPITSVTAAAGARRFGGRVINRRSFLIILPAHIRPGRVRVTVKTADGHAITFRRALNLVKNPTTS
jgi:hypothetical protein